MDESFCSVRNFLSGQTRKTPAPTEAETGRSSALGLSHCRHCRHSTCFLYAALGCGFVCLFICGLHRIASNAGGVLLTTNFNSSMCYVERLAVERLTADVSRADYPIIVPNTHAAANGDF